MNGRDILIGTGIGAFAAYMADPNSGRRRRALVRDQVVRATRKSRDAASTAMRDIANRTSGIAAASRARWRHEIVDDAVLIERVRATLGRTCSHPRAIEVHVANGHVTLSGPVLARERTHVLHAVESVRGVRSVINKLKGHEAAERVPSLQGEGNVAGPHLDILHSHWAPATQALVAAAGIAATGAVVAAFAGRR